MKILMRMGILMLFCASTAWAQHHHGGHQAPADTTRAQKKVKHEHHRPAVHKEHDMDRMDMDHGTMSTTLLPDVPMQREASGTAWLPDATASHGIHRMLPSGWNWMFHGTMFVRVTAQDAVNSGERGATALSVPNWFHAMGYRRVSDRGQFGLRGMFSLEPATEGGDGYPLLFQTGESWQDQPLVDRQHPHDFIGELAASYGESIGGRSGWFTYFGIVGEPALGPPAFMHRPSAQHNPDSPLGHHWQDATHISFGVGTLGLKVQDVKLDASIFTGREPDDQRFGIDPLRFDSYSGRLTYNPSAHWSLQTSAAFIKSPEWLEPDIDLYRYTASAMYQLQLHETGNWATSLIWGTNQPTEAHDSQHSILLESDLERRHHAYYTRLEWVQKPVHDLGLATLGERTFDIGALTFGAARDLARWSEVKLMLGAQGTLYAVPDDLQSIYGPQPVSVQVYLRLSPRELM